MSFFRVAYAYVARAGRLLSRGELLSCGPSVRTVLLYLRVARRAHCGLLRDTPCTCACARVFVVRTRAFVCMPARA